MRGSEESQGAGIEGWVTKGALIPGSNALQSSPLGMVFSGKPAMMLISDGCVRVNRFWTNSLDSLKFPFGLLLSRFHAIANSCSASPWERLSPKDQKHFRITAVNTPMTRLFSKHLRLAKSVP